MTLPFSIGQRVNIAGSPRYESPQEWHPKSFVIGQVEVIDGETVYSVIGMPWYPASSLRLVEELKIGDKVRTVEPEYDGIVFEFGGYDKKNDAILSVTCDPVFIEKIEDTLKMGDWVEIIGPSRHGFSEAHGVIFKIEQVLGHEYSAPGVAWYQAKCLRKLAPEEIQQHLSENTVSGIHGKYANIDGRLSTIESRLNSLAPSHAELLGDVEALAERVGAVEKRQREQHERIDRFMQDYREHKDFDFDMHDRIKALEGEMPEVCEGKPDRVICPNARFSPRSKCMFCGNGTDLCHDKLVRSACEYKVLDSMKEA